MDLCYQIIIAAGGGVWNAKKASKKTWSEFSLPPPPPQKKSCDISSAGLTAVRVLLPCCYLESKVAHPGSVNQLTYMKYHSMADPDFEVCKNFIKKYTYFLTGNNSNHTRKAR